MMPRRALPPTGGGPRVVALGGGHGLSASLQALRRVTDDLTAVVGVSDDGGSSGRLRREMGVPPPGDLRMALAALCGDDGWGRTWSRVVQHRFDGGGELSGHALGNLLIAALWQETGDIVVGLDWVAALLGAHGRVLPVATTALDVVADVRGLDSAAPEQVTRVHGQVAVATCGGTVVDLRLFPDDVTACAPAIEAVAGADVVVLGPGSWYTSVLAPLLVPGIAEAITSSRARVVVILNVGSLDREVIGLPPEEHLRVLAHHVPQLRLDTVVAEVSQVPDPTPLRTASADLGAELVLGHVCARDGSPHHDVDLLASVLGGVLLTSG
jgi:uncharacterized cofD-like protein